MSEQTEALRLADSLRDGVPYDEAEIENELRRLHASCEDYAQHKQRQDQRILTLTAQRDALLEALKYLDKEFRQHGRQHWPEAVRVRATIKAMEGETK